MSARSRLAALLGRGPAPSAPARPAGDPIPGAVASRLIPDNEDEPLFPKMKAYGRGRPGVTRERDYWWVIRDERGRVVGGAEVADLGRGHPPTIDVAVDPARRGEGWATRLYDELARRGVDVEACSSASLAHCTMTADGYRFMRARRLRLDPDAEAGIVASAGVCPACGPLDDHGRERR